MDVFDFAKILISTGNACGFDRDVYHREIEKRAAATKRPGESAAQAYTRVITEDPAGRELFKAVRMAPAPIEPPRQAAQDTKPKPAGPASEQLERMARAMAKEKKLTYQQAFSRLITDPDRKELLEEIKREESRQRAQVSDSRWPLHNAERESRTREWMNGDRRVG